MARLVRMTLAASAAAPAAAQESTHCVEVTPDLFAPPDAELRIIVMYDRPTLARAQEVVAKSAEYYEPVGLRLTAVFAPSTARSAEVTGCR